VETFFDKIIFHELLDTVALGIDWRNYAEVIYTAMQL
jgi:hypothetical protein